MLYEAFKENSEQDMSSKFLQANYYSYRDHSESLTLMKDLIRLAVRLGSETGLADIEWRLWLPLVGDTRANLLVTEEYQSASHWGQAEDIGIAHPELRSALNNAADYDVFPQDIHLLVEADKSGPDEDANYLEIATFPHRTLPNSIYKWLAARSEIISKQSGATPRARIFNTRVSGTRFGETQIWLSYAEGVEAGAMNETQIPARNFYVREY